MRILRWSVLTAILLGSVGAWLYLRWLERDLDASYALVEDRLYVGDGA
ncbi:MAG: hypothetical protein HQ567_18335 [Candidatus Nealsonbacteria bacterium]|nr:hypothetical protein [Candidatus Nealsonbacteria bacterium]